MRAWLVSHAPNAFALPHTASTWSLRMVGASQQMQIPAAPWGVVLWVSCAKMARVKADE